MAFNKVDAGSGAQWLLSGIALWRQNLLSLGLIGLLYGVLAAIPYVSLVVAVLGVLLTAGIVLAARQADEGQAPSIGMLFAAFTSGKVGRLLVLLLIGAVLAVIALMLLGLMLGTEGLEIFRQLATASAAGRTTPDPELIKQLPMGEIALWFGLMMIAALVLWLYTFFYMPLVLFNDAGVMQALKSGVKASIANIGAMLVYMLVSLVFAACVLFVMMLLTMLLSALLGDTVGPLVASALITGVLVPISSGAMYYAWKQVFGDGGAAGTTAATYA